MFRLGYNTNGLPHHRVGDALDLLAGLGYEGVALTPDAGLLDPFEVSPDEVAGVRIRADDLGLELTVETGSRYLLDARRKHFPTLLEDDPSDRARRVEFLCRCVDLAADLAAPVVSIWSGRAPDGQIGDPDPEGTGPARASCEAIWDRLVAGVSPVIERARSQGIRVAFEPEPGMFLERPSGFAELVQRLGADGPDLGLCLDVGHLLCTGDLPVPDVIHRFASSLVQVHLDDIKDGEHVHRMFGAGDLDLAGTLQALRDVGYEGMAAVELSRDGHRGPEAASEAMEHLRDALGRI